MKPWHLEISTLFFNRASQNGGGFPTDSKWIHHNSAYWFLPLNLFHKIIRIKGDTRSRISILKQVGDLTSSTAFVMSTFFVRQLRLCRANIQSIWLTHLRRVLSIKDGDIHSGRRYVSSVVLSGSDYCNHSKPDGTVAALPAFRTAWWDPSACRLL